MLLLPPAVQRVWELQPALPETLTLNEFDELQGWLASQPKHYHAALDEEQATLSKIRPHVTFVVESFRRRVALPAIPAADASSAPTTPPPTPLAHLLPPMSQAEMDIAQALVAVYPRAIKLADLRQHTRVSWDRGTLAGALESLDEIGLAHQPKGSRSGWAATKCGRLFFPH